MEDWHTRSVSISINADHQDRGNGGNRRSNTTSTSTTTNPKWPEMEELENLLSKSEQVKLPESSAFISMWCNKIFVISCAFAVLLDPLFSYIFLINDERKCMMTDNKLKLTYVFLRSATDVVYTLDLILCLHQKARKQRRRRGAMSTVSVKGSRSAAPFLLVQVFMALPLPQITLLTEKSVDSVLLTFAVIQYIIRVYRIYGWLGQDPNIASVKGSWLKAILDFLPFILAAHLFGAVWYYLAVDRVTTCWTQTIFEYDIDCDHHLKPTNNSMLEISCSKDRSNTTFPLGIYEPTLSSGLLDSTTHLSDKLLQGFWWGLRNLCSFGSNLEPTLPATQITLSISLSISGMVLFLIYFNERIKVFKKRSKRRKLRQMMQMMKPEIDLWLSRNSLPNDLKTMIVENIQRKLKKNSVIDTSNFLHCLPINVRRDVLTYLGITSLKTVPMFINMDPKVLKAMCEHLKLVVYNKDRYIIREGEPLEKMVFITRGTAWSYTTTTNNYSSTINCYVRGDFYGAEELLNWATEKFASFSEFPVSTRTLKAQAEVEGFVLGANDLKSVVGNFWWHFYSKNRHQLSESQFEHWRNLAASCIQTKWRMHREKDK